MLGYIPEKWFTCALLKWVTQNQRYEKGNAKQMPNKIEVGNINNKNLPPGTWHENIIKKIINIIIMIKKIVKFEVIIIKIRRIMIEINSNNK